MPKKGSSSSTKRDDTVQRNPILELEEQPDGKRFFLMRLPVPPRWAVAALLTMLAVIVLSRADVSGEVVERVILQILMWATAQPP